jgi:hypothetical protein
MSRIHISTISLSSKTEEDLKQQLKDLYEKTQGDGRIYEIGKFYEPVLGYIAVDIYVFLPLDKVMVERAIERFEKNEEDSEENKTIH